jgi:hypothetical protein
MVKIAQFVIKATTPSPAGAARSLRQLCREPDARFGVKSGRVHQPRPRLQLWPQFTLTPKAGAGISYPAGRMGTKQ